MTHWQAATTSGLLLTVLTTGVIRDIRFLRPVGKPQQRRGLLLTVLTTGVICDIKFLRPVGKPQ